LVKPSYKDYWSLPGGVVENNESPQIAAIRETKEEIGIAIENPRLLCITYTSDPEPKGESLQFVFYGGILSKAQITLIKLQESELTEWKFLTLKDAIAFTNKKTALRLPLCLDAIRKNSAFYLETKG
jgi:ADP-ribose pyrophosphatase YjhB (NUDIX family)